MTYAPAIVADLTARAALCDQRAERFLQMADDQKRAAIRYRTDTKAARANSIQPGLD